MQPRLIAASFVVVTMVPAAVRVRHELESERRWWRVPTMQRQLRLTTAQIETLDTVFQRELPERIIRHRTITNLDRQLGRMMETAVDDDVAQLSEEVEALRAEQNIRRTLMLFEMYQTLTLEQRERLADIHRYGRGSRPYHPTELR